MEVAYFTVTVRVLSEIFPDFDEISIEENKTKPKMAFDLKGLRRAGAFSRAFTIFLTLQCRGFSRALISEKSKSPLMAAIPRVLGGPWLQMTSA